MELEMDRHIGAASAVMLALYCSVVVKNELSQKAKLSIYRSIYVPTLSCGQELWVVTKRTKSRIQAAKMSFLCMVSGLSLRDKSQSLGQPRWTQSRVAASPQKEEPQRWLGS